VSPEVEGLIKEMRRLSAILDKGLKTLHDQAHELAEADHEHTKAFAMAYLRAEGTAKGRACHADLATLESRQRLKLAEALERATREGIHSRQSQLSAVQSVANAVRAEINLAR
jgi:hypothetical protein